MRSKTLAAAGLGALALAIPAQAVENPPSGIPPSEFATQYEGCLGQLRSMIARGDFAGVGPFGEHFTGLVNPGAHQGTVGEEEFLETVMSGSRPTSWQLSALSSRARERCEPRTWSAAHRGRRKSQLGAECPRPGRP